METKITTVSLAAKEDKYYADKTLYQWNYGQILRIVDADLPMVVEVGFSTTEKSGNSDVRVGSTNNGVTTVAIPNKLFEEERSTDYSIYAFVYVTDENSGTTVHEIVIPVKARAKQGDPSEDPSIDPSIFEDAINAVNASAERAETAEKSAKESADKAKEYAESAGKSKGDVEKARDSAISAIGIEKESALRGIESKTVESLQKIQSQTEASQNSIKQSIADATKKKTELDGAISNATEAKGNLDKAVQSAGNAKKELDTSVGKAVEAKTALDSSINSAGEKQLALDATVAKADTLDKSLKKSIQTGAQLQKDIVASGKKAVEDIQLTGNEQLGKMQIVAEEFAADREQIGKNTQAISSLNEDLSNKITKFYASNQGETHLADSDNGKIMDMMLYGRSEQKQYHGKNLLPTTMYSGSVARNGVTFINNGDGSVSVSGTATDTTYFTLWGYNELGDKGVLQGIAPGDVLYISDCMLQQTNSEKIIDIASNSSTSFYDSTTTMYVAIKVVKGESVNRTFYPQIEKGSEFTSYEPYVGGKPSPSPDYQQEIKSVVNPTVKVTNEDGTQFETVTLPYTLNAIPVASGGNVTIDGQQYIADYVDAERGKLVRMCKYKKLLSANIRSVISGKLMYIDVDEIWDVEDNYTYREFYMLCSVGIGKLITVANGGWKGKARIEMKNVQFTHVDEAKNYFDNNDVYACYPIPTPEEIPITMEEVSAFKQLLTYYPVTNISVNSEQLDGYTVFNYPISMANGWNYVKQQLGDTRDYIYDMDAKAQDIDLQSAEAYVNSEYAVALTELEV